MLKENGSLRVTFSNLIQAIKDNPVLLSFNIALTATVFVFDLLLPADVPDGMLYLAPVAWIALWSSQKESSLVVAMAAACTILALLGFTLSAPDTVWIGLINRAFVVLVIWVTAVLSLLRKRTEDEMKTLRGLLPICSYCKKIRDDQGYWKQIEVYIAAHSQADFSHGLCPECGMRHYPDVFPEQQTGT